MGKMSVSSYEISEYEEFCGFERRENKANFKGKAKVIRQKAKVKNQSKLTRF